MTSDLFQLKGKTAWVTGALGLLGREHCVAFRDAGAKVIVCDQSLEEVERFAEELGGGAIGIACDITSRQSLKDSLQYALTQTDSVDILVNNAAINDKFENPLLASEESRFETYPLELWEAMLNVNVTGTFLCCQVIGSQMAKQRRGSIINIASTYGLVGPDQSLYQDSKGKQKFYKGPAYSATKGAVIAFTRYLAAYWGKAGVRINTLSPGGVENNQDADFVSNYSKRTPLGRMAKKEDYRGALVFLASEASAYMTGANLVVDGGWTTW